MSQLLVPVYRGELEYIGKDDAEMRKDFERWACERFGTTPENTDVSNFYNPLMNQYCYPEYRQLLINDALKSGKVIVGMDCNCW